MQPDSIGAELPGRLRLAGEKMLAPAPSDEVRQQPEIGDLDRPVLMLPELEIASRPFSPCHEPDRHPRNRQVCAGGLVTPAQPVGPLVRPANLRIQKAEKGHWALAHPF